MTRVLATTLLVVLLGCVGTQTRTEPPPPEWLTALEVGDTLVYHVGRRDQADISARIHVARLIRRGAGVAALLWPEPETARELRIGPRWLAADEHGIHQVAPDGEVRDPRFVPLDENGRFVRTSRVAPETTRHGPGWSLPHARRADEQALGGGWEVDELDFQLEGPIRGDRCARIMRRDGDETRRIAVCANVGVVEVQVERGEMNRVEHWRLVEITRPVGAGL